MPDEEEQSQPRDISTPSESALASGKRGALVGSDRLPSSAPGRNFEQRRGRAVETTTTITATAIPSQQLLGHNVTIGGHLTSGGGADIVGVSVALYNTDDPTNEVRIATTITDSSGNYHFTLTDSVATTHRYTVYARGQSTYSRAKSTEVLVAYHPSLLRDVSRAALAHASTLKVSNLAWYDLLAIFLILAGEGLLFAGYLVAGVGVQALNVVAVSVIVVALHGERVQLVQALALVSLFRVVNLSFALVPTVTLLLVGGDLRRDVHPDHCGRCSPKAEPPRPWAHRGPPVDIPYSVRHPRRRGASADRVQEFSQIPPSYPHTRSCGSLS